MEKWSFQRIRELMTPIALRGMAGNKIGCARISMMVRSMNSNARPDTLMQDRTLQAHRFLLQRTAGPYIGVKTGSARSKHIPSGCPPGADIIAAFRHFREWDGPAALPPPTVFRVRRGLVRKGAPPCPARPLFTQ